MHGAPNSPPLSCLDSDPESRSSAARLSAIEGFGTNPGNLGMLVYTPARVAKNPALVVVLHGCTQTAKLYDAGSGWSALAERGGFILLYAEQRKANNSHLCFNWFNPEDVRRDNGEVCSIRQMIGRVVADHGVDAARIFITGLSAGGAMTGAMLATYPDLFAGGAIIAGLPYGAASSVSEALRCMYTGCLHQPRTWGDFVREAATGHAGRWPTVSVWYGLADTTVKPINAGEIVKQWTDVHHLSDVAPDVALVGPATRRRWRDADDKVCVLEYGIPGLGHGTPLDGHGGPDDGTIGPFFLAAGLWSSLRIAQDWGLFDEAGKPRKPSLLALLGLRFLEGLGAATHR